MPDMILRLVLAALFGGGQIAAPAQAIRGFSTWYDAPSIHDAAAGPALRAALGKHWRGTTVTVCRVDEAAVSAPPYAGWLAANEGLLRSFNGSRADVTTDPAGWSAPASSGSDCITTRLTDWCLCSKGHRVIDLDDRAFRELAPLSRGVVPVVVSWGDSIPLPATDTED